MYAYKKFIPYSYKSVKNPKLKHSVVDIIPITMGVVICLVFIQLPYKLAIKNYFVVICLILSFIKNLI